MARVTFGLPVPTLRFAYIQHESDSSEQWLIQDRLGEYPGRASVAFVRAVKALFLLFHTRPIMAAQLEKKIMTSHTDYELLKDAYAIIDGIPDEAIAFGAPCKVRGRSLDNGTICSPEGWLAQHPQFVALGLGVEPDGASLQFLGEKLSPVPAMAKVFRMPEEEAARLFGDRSEFIGGGASTQASDKQLWLSRVRHHIHDRALVDTMTTMAAAPVAALAKIADVIEGEPR